MKFSLLTALTLAWLYGMLAGMVLSHGPLALALYGLVLLAVSGAAHVIHQAITHQLALVKFHQEVQTARRLAAQQVGGHS